MPNIHTLQSTTTQSKVVGQYPKDKHYRHAIKKWFKIADANATIGKISVMPTDSVGSKRGVSDIRDEDGKVITWGVRTAVDRPSYQLWTNDKMVEWCSARGSLPAPIETGDYGLAINISGRIGVLDFDCEKDWNWFKSNFHIDLSKYIVCSNISKHDCGCGGEGEKTHHLYFKIDDYFNAIEGRVVRCIYNGQGTSECDRRTIDFLQQARTGTPQVVKIPSGQDDRVMVSCPADYKINKLPAEVSLYFKSNWVMSAKELNSQQRAYKYIDLVRAIPTDALREEGAKKITAMYRELYGIGVDSHTITELALEHLKAFSGTTIVRHPDGRDFTPEETTDWIDMLCSNYEPTSRNTFTINSLCKEHNIGEYMNISMRWLKNMGTHFDTSYLYDIKYNIQDANERKKWVLNYYNKFFVITTGCAKNKIYYRKYDKEGNIVDINHYQNKADFVDYCGIGMIIQEGGKEVDTASWWFKQKNMVYDKVVFQPYGILKRKHKIPYSTFNAFTGFNMKYINDYNKPEHDEKGDAIDKHLREVLCWDNKTAGGVNEELYNYNRAWYYKHAVVGEKTNVCMTYYSKEKGTGKSLWISGYQKYVIGKANSLVNSSFVKMTKDTFTDYYENLCLLIIEEMPDNSHKIKDAWDFMKNLITGEDMTARKFQTAPDKMDLHLSSICATNHFYSMDKDFADRRMCGNRVSSHRKNDIAYFDKLAWACDSYEGWENWVHRYLIQKYHEFSHIRISPTSSLIPNTQYRKELMRRGNDCVLYFFKELLENMEDPLMPDNPYHQNLGRTMSLAGLWDKYRSWRTMNNITNCNLDSQRQFVNDRLVARYEFNIRPHYDEHKPKFGADKKQEGRNVIKTCRTRRGESIIFDKEFIEQLKTLIRHTTFDDTEALVATTEENDENEIDLDAIMTGELEFLPEDNF